MTSSSYNRVSRLATFMAAGLALFVALAPVSIFGFFVYSGVIRNLDSNLRVQALVLENAISAQPDYWDVNSDRLYAVYQRYVTPGEYFHILNKEGKTIVEVGPAVAWHTIVRSHPLHDFGREVGRIEGGISVLDATQFGLAVFCASLGAAWLIWVPLRRLPLTALAAAEARVLRRDRYQRALLDNFPFTVWLKDADDRFLAANSRFAERLGQRSSESLIGKKAAELVPADLARACGTDDGHVLQTGQPTQQEVRVESGSECRWFEIYQAPVFLPSGEALGTVGYSRDISDKKSIQEELEQHRHQLEALVQSRTAQLSVALDAAESANRAKSEFFSRMSHELRTPLNAILGFGQLLEMSADSSTPEQRESVKFILSAGHQLLELVNQLLDLSRIDIGKLELNIQPVRIADLAASCVGQVAVAMASQGNVTIENLIADPALLVQGDDLRLRQVLLNLLGNAVKYNRENGRVTLSSVIEKQGSLRIEVRDTGHGIAHDKLSLLFTPFERLDQKHGTIPGMGIGLHITRQLVEAMHGTVGVASEPGKGSTFWFDLPLAEEASAAAVTP